MSTPPPLPTSRRPQRNSRQRESTEKFTLRQRFTNPLLVWEVLRAGRRTGQLALARTTLGACLLLAMWALWSTRFDASHSFTGSGIQIGKELGRFAENFAITFFFVQSLAVFLLTPVFVAGAIFEERETRSGEILLTTRLTRREVYIGKVGARIAQVLLVILAGLPILFLTQLWGGVSEGIIIVCYIAVCISTVSAGTITAAVSAYAETMRAAILRSYLMIFIFQVLIFPASPMLIILMSAAHWIAGAVGFLWSIPLQCGIVGVSYTIGQRWLRLAMLRQKKRLDEGERAVPPLPNQRKLGFQTLSETESPLLWKELEANSRVKLHELWGRFFSAGYPKSHDRIDVMGIYRWCLISPEPVAVFGRLLTTFFSIFFVVMMFLDIISSYHFLRILGGILLCWYMMSIGLAAAGSIAKERQKQTLIDLFMLPGPRRELLYAKWRGSLAYGEVPAILLGLLVFAALITQGLTPLAVFPLILGVKAFGLFSASLGILLSTFCRSVVQSNVWMMGVLGVIIIGFYLLAEGTLSSMRLENGTLITDYAAWTRPFNPMLVWGRFLVTYDHAMGLYVWKDVQNKVPFQWIEYSIAMTGIIWALLAAGVCWLLAVRRFDREGRY